MAENEMPPQQTMAELKKGRTDDVTGRAILLWKSIAAHLVPIIGSDGFSILYARSLHLTQVAYPWMAAGQTPQSTEAQLATLKINLDAHVAEADAANRALLVTFTNILAVLIGEPLSTGILRAAWGDDASEATSKARSPEHE